MSFIPAKPQTARPPGVGNYYNGYKTYEAMVGSIYANQSNNRTYDDKSGLVKLIMGDDAQYIHDNHDFAFFFIVSMYILAPMWFVVANTIFIITEMPSSMVYASLTAPLIMISVAHCWLKHLHKKRNNILRAEKIFNKF